MSKETQAILTNKEAIAIDQDKAGMEGFKYKDNDSLEVWVKPLENDDWASMFFKQVFQPDEIKL